MSGVLPNTSAYLLVSHGSRDPRPQAAVEELATLVAQKVGLESEWMQKKSDRSSLAAPPVTLSPLVGTAVLELGDQPLHEQIRQFSDRAHASGLKHLQVLPLFLLPGVHVMEDIPEQVAIASIALESKLTIEIRPHLGVHPGLSRLLATSLASVNADASILLSHGSRRVGGNQPVEAIAATLGAVPAYWSVSPSLEERLEDLVSAKYSHIGILPYFLFTGGITDAILTKVKLLSKQFPTSKLHLAEPIGASAELADLIWDLRSK